MDKQDWINFVVKVHGCAPEAAERAWDNNATPRQAEIDIKIQKASEAVMSWKSWSEPQCTCDSKLLFDEGCKCSYSKWKKSQ